MVEPGLDRKDIPFIKYVIPVGIEVRPLVCREPYSVSQMMKEQTWILNVKKTLYLMVYLPA